MELISALQALNLRGLSASLRPLNLGAQEGYLRAGVSAKDVEVIGSLGVGPIEHKHLPTYFLEIFCGPKSWQCCFLPNDNNVKEAVFFACEMDGRLYAFGDRGILEVSSDGLLILEIGKDLEEFLAERIKKSAAILILLMKKISFHRSVIQHQKFCFKKQIPLSE